MSKREKCHYSGKRRYPTLEKALDHIATIRKLEVKPETIPTRAYECLACGGWHLTSQTESIRSYFLRNQEFKRFLKEED